MNHNDKTTLLDPMQSQDNVFIQSGDSVTISCGASSLILHRDGTIVVKGKNLFFDSIATHFSGIIHYN